MGLKTLVGAFYQDKTPSCSPLCCLCARAKCQIWISNEHFASACFLLTTSRSNHWKISVPTWGTTARSERAPSLRGMRYALAAAHAARRGRDGPSPQAPDLASDATQREQDGSCSPGCRPRDPIPERRRD